MDNEIEQFKIIKKEKHNEKENRNCKLNIILNFQFINLLLILLISFYLSQFIFFNDQNKQKTEEKSKWTILEKIKYLRLLTNNDEKSYKGIQECLLNDPDQKFCIYHFRVK